MEPRLVFFGMDGGYSCTVLRALAGAELKPKLVVLGKHAPRGALAPVVEVVPASPGLFGRLLGVAGDAPAVETTSLSRLARALGIDVVETTDTSALRARTRIAAVGADAFVIAGFPRLLPKAVLDLAARGTINVHPGRLPEERGPAPLFWALKAGRTRIGWSIHLADEGEDTGDVLATGEIEFTPPLDGELLLVRIAQAASMPLVRAVRSLLAGDLVRIPQPRIGAARRPRPEFRDGKIDPGLPALAVYTFVTSCARAYSLFAECGGDRFFIESAASFDPEGKMAFEYALTGDRLLLACTPGIVELTLKPEGALFAAEYR